MTLTGRTRPLSLLRGSVGRRLGETHRSTEIDSAVGAWLAPGRGRSRRWRDVWVRGHVGVEAGGGET